MSDEAEKPKRPLTAKQQAFVSAYLTNGFNATQAAITAGYSKKNANKIGPENLVKLGIQQPIKKELDNLRTHALLTKEGRAAVLIEMAEVIKKQLEEREYKEVKETGGQYGVTNEFFDEARYNAYLKTLDDLAREMGDRKQTNDTKHSGGVEISFAWKKAEK